ncbi:MAG TPA: hypothetical protein VF407_06890 [Polyangiaceae bacterium]
MRGDVVFRIYGLHTGRAKDSYFGTFPTRALAEAEIAKLSTREMNGESWAARHHDRGFEIREHVVDTDFEIPSKPKPRDRFVVAAAPKPNGPGIMDSLTIDVFRRGEERPVARYERNHSGLYSTFEPFRQGTRELALISRDYRRTAVLDLATGEVVAEEKESDGEGFCPIGFYVPDWWDVNDGSILPGSEYWTASNEWPGGDFGFVWGCVWGDDSSWKIQYLDLRRVREGIVLRDDRFGYVPVATFGWSSPCFDDRSAVVSESKSPPFLRVRNENGKPSVRIAVETVFGLDDGERFDP